MVEGRMLSALSQLRPIVSNLGSREDATGIKDPETPSRSV